MSWGEIKKAINSTLGTSGFLPLDLLIQYNIDKTNGKDVVEFESSGTHTTHVPIWANNVRITAAAGGGGGFANDGGGGGGGAAILNELYTVPNALKNTNISVSVGGGGRGAYYSSDGYVQGPYDGNNTRINAFNIMLVGGKHGTRTTGGAAGGTGGGAGGHSTAGSAGISGAGGNGGYRYGGGGGSLGAGGNGNYSNGEGDIYGGSGNRGGGGGGCYSDVGNSYAHGGNGGDGYVKLEWLL